MTALESDSGALAAAKAALAGTPNVEFVEGGLSAGAAGKAPFDVIVINGAFETAPNALLDQLAPGGRLVGVDARSDSMRGVIIDKAPAGFSERSLFDARLRSCRNFEKSKLLHFKVNNRAGRRLYRIAPKMG